MATAGDKLFQKVTRMAVPVAKLQRRVPLQSNKLTPFASFNRDILQGMKVTSVSMDDSTSGTTSMSEEFIKSVVSDAGGKYEHVNQGGKVDAIVCDARAIKSLDNLQLLHQKLHPIVKNLSKNGRFVMIGGSDGDGSKPTSVSAGITAGLGGFTKALGKEVAGKGNVCFTVHSLYGMM